MTFKEMQAEDSSFLKYELLKIQMTLHAQVPVEAIRIANSKTVKFIIIKQSKSSGITSTKTIVVPAEDSPFFDSWITGDFPDLPLTVYDSQKGGVADEQEKNNG